MPAQSERRPMPTPAGIVISKGADEERPAEMPVMTEEAPVMGEPRTPKARAAKPRPAKPRAAEARAVVEAGEAVIGHSAAAEGRVIAHVARSVLCQRAGARHDQRGHDRRDQRYLGAHCYCLHVRRPHRENGQRAPSLHTITWC